MPFYQMTDEGQNEIERQNLLMRLLVDGITYVPLIYLGVKGSPVEEIKFKQTILHLKEKYPEMFGDYNIDSRFIYPRSNTLDDDIEKLKLHDDYITETDSVKPRYFRKIITGKNGALHMVAMQTEERLDARFGKDTIRNIRNEMKEYFKLPISELIKPSDECTAVPATA